MRRKINISDACRLAIKERQRGLIIKYGIWSLILSLYIDRQYNGVPLDIRTLSPSDTLLSRTTKQLNRRNVISDDLDFGSNVYRCNEVPDQTPEELCCTVDPFSYVSHLSAMQRYGLTDRRPAKLILTTASRDLWREKARQKERADFSKALSEFGNAVGMRLPHHSIPKSVRGREILLRKSSEFGDRQSIRDTDARISTVGQTFLDMIVEPSLCGGMQHVIEIWRREAQNYLDELIAAVDRCGSKITKVRAGYLLDEELGFADSRVQAWRIFVQRGGSRRLDPSKPYRPKWSENWSISLNA